MCATLRFGVDLVGPFELDGLSDEEFLEVGEVLIVLVDLLGTQLVLQAVGGEQAGAFADVPLDGVEAVAAVGDVGDAEVLAGGEEVSQALGDEGAERNLEGQAGDVDVVFAGGAGVEIDAVVADADGVGEEFRGLAGLEFVDGQLGAESRGGADVVFGDGEEGFDPAGFAKVGGHGEAVICTGDFRDEIEVGVALAFIIEARGFRLHPIEQGEGELAGFFEVDGDVVGRFVDDVVFPVVVLGPIDERNFMGRVGDVDVSSDDLAILPEGGCLGVI